MLSEKIKRIFNENRRTYGWRRIARMLAREGIRCGKERILRLMKRQGLRPVQKRPGRPKTTHSRHDQPVAINRLKGPEPLSGVPNSYIPKRPALQRDERARQREVGAGRPGNEVPVRRDRT